MNGDDITHSDANLPIFDEGTPLWKRVLCVLGYHKRETRVAPRRRNGYGDMIGPSKLRDQCGRCHTYL